MALSPAVAARLSLRAAGHALGRGRGDRAGGDQYVGDGDQPRARGRHAGPAAHHAHPGGRVPAREAARAGAVPAAPAGGALWHDARRLGARDDGRFHERCGGREDDHRDGRGRGAGDSARGGVPAPAGADPADGLLRHGGAAVVAQEPRHAVERCGHHRGRRRGERGGRSVRVERGVEHRGGGPGDRGTQPRLAAQRVHLPRGRDGEHACARQCGRGKTGAGRGLRDLGGDLGGGVLRHPRQHGAHL